jgi:hypothetical protein
MTEGWVLIISLGFIGLLVILGMVECALRSHEEERRHSRDHLPPR